MTPTPLPRTSPGGPLRRQALLALSTLVLAVLCLGTTSCNSTGKTQRRGDVPPMRVIMRDFSGGFDLVIVNDAWLVNLGIEGATPAERKTAFQSQRLSVEASTAKVYPDGVIDAFVQAIENDLDQKRFMIQGPVGRNSLVFSTALEITEGDSMRHVGGGKNVQGTRDEKMRYWEARRAFTEIYNAQFSLQAVEDPYGGGKR